MKNEIKKSLFVGLGLLLTFPVWTMLVCFFDVRAIGPEGSFVGFAAFNGFVHRLMGANMLLYAVTDWLGLVPIATAFGFAVYGLVQWIKGKSIIKVERNILALGIFYIVVIAVYILFETVVINYRPVLINGYLEASYPSSTTMLVMSVMPTSAMQFKMRIGNAVLSRCAEGLTLAFTVFMVVGRVLSGVHWITDIIGGAILSVGLVSVYYAVGLCE